MNYYTGGLDSKTFAAWVITYMIGCGAMATIMFLLMGFQFPRVIYQTLGPLCFGYMLLLPQYLFLGPWLHALTEWDSKHQARIINPGWATQQSWLGFVYGIMISVTLFTVYRLPGPTSRAALFIPYTMLLIGACVLIWLIIGRFVAAWNVKARWSSTVALAIVVGLLSAGISTLITTILGLSWITGNVVVGGASFGLGYAMTTGSLLGWVIQAPGYHR